MTKWWCVVRFWLCWVWSVWTKFNVGCDDDIERESRRTTSCYNTNMIDWYAASSLPSGCVWLYPQNCSFYIPQINWIDVCTWLSARWQHRWSLEWLDDETAPTHLKHGLGKTVYVFFSFLSMNLSWVSVHHHLLGYEGITQAPISIRHSSEA